MGSARFPPPFTESNRTLPPSWTRPYRDQRVILGGDLNISPQVPSPDAKHHELVIERIKAFGPIDCLGSLPALNRHGFSGGS